MHHIGESCVHINARLACDVILQGVGFMRDTIWRHQSQRLHCWAFHMHLCRWGGLVAWCFCWRVQLLRSTPTTCCLLCSRKRLHLVIVFSVFATLHTTSWVSLFRLVVFITLISKRFNTIRIGSWFNHGGCIPAPIIVFLTKEICRISSINELILILHMAHPLQHIQCTFGCLRRPCVCVCVHN